MQFFIQEINWEMIYKLQLQAKSTINNVANEQPQGANEEKIKEEMELYQSFTSQFVVKAFFENLFQEQLVKVIVPQCLKSCVQYIMKKGKIVVEELVVSINLL